VRSRKTADIRLRRAGPAQCSAFFHWACALSGGACEPRACAPRIRHRAAQTVTCSGNTPAGFQAGGGVQQTSLFNVLSGATVNDKRFGGDRPQRR